MEVLLCSPLLSVLNRHKMWPSVIIWPIVSQNNEFEWKLFTYLTKKKKQIIANEMKYILFGDDGSKTIKLLHKSIYVHCTNRHSIKLRSVYRIISYN